MRFDGTLQKWSAERGFGFIVATQGGQEIFVHLTAFPPDGRKPVAGESLSFEIELDRDGKKRATRVLRKRPQRSTAARTRESRSDEHGRSRSGRQHSQGVLRGLLMLAIAAALGWYAYDRWEARGQNLRAFLQQADTAPVLARPLPIGNNERFQLESPATVPAPLPQSSYRCDGRMQCAQMHSCAEATYFLKNCPGTQLDGDGDGIPCEKQWCNRG
jgi:cold shock CspA family protein